MSANEESRALWGVDPVPPALADDTLVLVPARGGSKGIPRKNVRPLDGRPLIAHTLEHARAAGLSRVVLSTEDDEIATLGEQLGFELPFRRPTELAADETPTLDVLLHALAALRELGDPRGQAGFVLLLQPTAPLRDPRWIRRAFELLADPDADAAMTVLPVPCEHHPEWVYLRAEDGALRLFSGAEQPPPRRQDLAPAFHREGSVYLVRRRVLEESRSLYGRRTLGIEVPRERSINLDDEDDWRRAERWFQTREVQGAP
ncbi:MAG: acylneuraminate cytidylyltransferase family protein [Acidobacteria bacterium]|nr:MAG: acylneuraminate cytidylyltransferase family protein [Acidobacteriota bacterium]REK07291.1 MAG: acylneuraminate cytidylyltransferase family protein [Acidobacteriota bacterium]